MQKFIIGLLFVTQSMSAFIGPQF